MPRFAQRADLVTLGVPDLDEARRFYVEGLGWEPALDVPGEVLFLQIGHGVLLGLWGAEAMAADVGGAAFAPGPAPIVLSHNVGSEEEVVALLAAAEAAGGTILKPAMRASFGGFHGYFADPAGFRWEVATSPGWSVAPDGRGTIGVVDP